MGVLSLGLALIGSEWGSLGVAWFVATTASGGLFLSMTSGSGVTKGVSSLGLLSSNSLGITGVLYSTGP